MVPFVDGTHVEEGSSDGDEEHLVQNEASERPHVVQALEDDSERKRSYVDAPTLTGGLLSEIRDHPIRHDRI